MPSSPRTAASRNQSEDERRYYQRMLEQMRPGDTMMVRIPTRVFPPIRPISPDEPTCIEPAVERLSYAEVARRARMLPIENEPIVAQMYGQNMTLGALEAIMRSPMGRYIDQDAFHRAYQRAMEQGLRGPVHVWGVSPAQTSPWDAPIRGQSIDRVWIDDATIDDFRTHRSRVPYIRQQEPQMEEPHGEHSHLDTPDIEPDITVSPLPDEPSQAPAGTMAAIAEELYDLMCNQVVEGVNPYRQDEQSVGDGAHFVAVVPLATLQAVDYMHNHQPATNRWLRELADTCVGNSVILEYAHEGEYAMNASIHGRGNRALLFIAAQAVHKSTNELTEEVYGALGYGHLMADWPEPRERTAPRGRRANAVTALIKRCLEIMSEEYARHIPPSPTERPEHLEVYCL